MPASLFSAVEYPVKVDSSATDFLLMFWFSDYSDLYGQIMSLSGGAIKAFINASYVTNETTIYFNEFFVHFTIEDRSEWNHFAVSNLQGQIKFYLNGELIKTSAGSLPVASSASFFLGNSHTIEFFDIRLFTGSFAFAIDAPTLVYYRNNVNDNNGDKILPYA